MAMMSRFAFNPERDPGNIMHVCERCHIPRRQDASTSMLGSWICNRCDGVFKEDWYVSDKNMMKKSPEEINELQLAFLNGDPNPPEKKVEIDWKEIADA